jgi:polyisoprenoid-binding protein YceI
MKWGDGPDSRILLTDSILPMNTHPPNAPNRSTHWTTFVTALIAAAGLVLAGLAGSGAAFDATPFTLTGDSELYIDGTSNVHDWTCDVSTVTGTMAVDTAATRSQAGPTFQNARVRVPLSAVDCGRDGMTENLREAMQAEDHPAVRYRAVSTSVKPHPDSAGWFQVTAAGPMTVAGSTRTAKVVAAGQRLDDGRVRLAGETSLDMTTFGVEPPTAMLGALQTGETVTVRFDVTAAPADTSAGAAK